MQPSEDPGAFTAGAQPTRVDREFAAIVRGLAVDDPRFVRRLTAPARGRLTTGHVMVTIGVLATVVLGIVPLALGLHLQVIALLVVGAAGCVLLPVVAPLVARRVVRHVRPLLP